MVAIIVAIINLRGNMKIDTSEIISITAANQSFSNVAKIADKKGRAVVFRNNRPKYVLMNLDESPVLDLTDDEKIDVVAARILKRHKEAFLELAK